MDHGSEDGDSYDEEGPFFDVLDVLDGRGNTGLGGEEEMPSEEGDEDEDSTGDDEFGVSESGEDMDDDAVRMRHDEATPDPGGKRNVRTGHRLPETMAERREFTRQDREHRSGAAQALVITNRAQQLARGIPFEEADRLAAPVGHGRRRDILGRADDVIVGVRMNRRHLTLHAEAPLMRER